MNPSHLAGTRPKTLLALLATAAIATTGCSNMSTATRGASASAAIKTIPGKIHGGNQPVSGATVNLYFAGQTTFAAGASRVATTTSSSDGSGSFNFQLTAGAPNDGSSANFSCPASGNPYLFVVAKGGTTVNTAGATANPDAEFIAPLGRCTGITGATVYMSEVVTVATMASIHQFMNSSSLSASAPIESTVGSDGILISDLALAHSFENITNMVSLTTGLANASLTKNGAVGLTGVTMTITPEQAKINQLANILSSCINQSGGGSANCQSIYTSAVPPTNGGPTSVGAVGSTATDLLTALYYIFTNPTNGGTPARTTLYNLSPASGAPYQPTLTAIPTDWSIGLKFTAAGVCTGSTANFLSNPTDLSFGLNGNLFVTNGQAGAGSVAEITPDGAPASCLPVTVNAGTTGAGAAGTAYDINNNVWVGSSTSPDLYRYTPASSTSTVSGTLHVTTAAPVTSITTDGFGDVFFAATNGNLYELSRASAATTAPVPVLISSAPLGTAPHIMIDSGNKIWASTGTSSITYTQGTVSGSTLTFAAGATTVVTATTNTSGIASTSSSGNGVFYSSIGGTSSITSLINNAGSYIVSGSYPVTGGGLNGPSAIALDGQQNVWAANGTTGSLSGFDRNGAALTPATGFQKDATFLGPQSSILVDTSGNIWLGLSGSSTVTEIVGAAVPVYQPYSNGLAPEPNRFQQIP